MMSDKEDSTELTDKELVALVQKDDIEAFEVLMDKYIGRAYQIALGILGSKSDAEEVAQDAFIRIHRALPNFRGDSEFSTWMYRIVVNQSRNRYRWNKRRGSQSTFSIDAQNEDRDRPTFEIVDKSMSPDKEMVLDELESEIIRKMNDLPDTNKEALILRNIKELSYDQIADILECKVGTVKSRIARAREELRKNMGL
ncbi:MAG: sigma-70 family RNA polymerase sigma factor [Lentisphaeria bacterium]|nr:sigma-70 family RNA polymerase sigma factor [Lentisphaeria bacterium]NQZ68898.1 sigma-70 family RNA polymerase sigma factor [Lentisphaeria bacterium]